LLPKFYPKLSGKTVKWTAVAAATATAAVTATATPLLLLLLLLIGILIHDSRFGSGE